MSATTFSGPLRAGPIRNTTGTTVGSNVANVGYAVLAQKVRITQSTTATATSIVIPANSAIVSITSYAETDFTSDFGIGTTAAANEVIPDATCAAGVTSVNPGTDVCAGVWQNVGTSDVQLYIKAASAGIGVGYLVVTYAQAINANNE